MSAPADVSDDVRITITALHPDDVETVVGRVAAVLGPVTGRSDVVGVKDGRYGASVSFSRRTAAGRGVGQAKSTKPGAKPEPEPTSEQREVVDATRELRAGEGAAVISFAGTGKTTLLVNIARARASDNILYFAFNKDVVADSKGRFPRNVTAGTAHSIARRMVPAAQGREVGKLDMAQLASVCEIPQRTGAINRRQMAWFVNACLNRFAESADLEIGLGHVPYDTVISLSSSEGRIADFARRAWAAILGGRLVLPHFAYLKLWQIALASGDDRGPSFDLVLLDEAQDVNEVIADIAGRIRAPLVRVGDPFQSIYSWRGAIDALDRGPGRRFYLTKSFRFGSNVAGLATRVLSMHPDFYKEGARRIEGAAEDFPIGTGPDATTILCRSNAGVLDEALHVVTTSDARISVVGGMDEIERLVDDACELKAGRRPQGREFSSYTYWAELMSAVEAGIAGEVAFIAKYVDTRGVSDARKAIQVLRERSTSESEADIVLSTIHKAKGREWDSVRLAPDCRGVEELGKLYANAKGEAALRAAKEEVNLLYVAVTRARKSVRLPSQLMALSRPGFRFVVPGKG